jgi:hypothetical protein
MRGARPPANQASEAKRLHPDSASGHLTGKICRFRVPVKPAKFACYERKPAKFAGFVTAKPAIYDIGTGNPRQPNRQFTTAKPAIHFEVRPCGQ